MAYLYGLALQGPNLILKGKNPGKARLMPQKAGLSRAQALDHGSLDLGRFLFQLTPCSLLLWPIVREIERESDRKREREGEREKERERKREREREREKAIKRERKRERERKR